MPRPTVDAVLANADEVWAAFNNAPVEAFKAYRCKLLLLTAKRSNHAVLLTDGRLRMFHSTVIEYTRDGAKLLEYRDSPEKGYYVIFTDESHVPTGTTEDFTVVARLVETREQVVVFETLAAVDTPREV